MKIAGMLKAFLTDNTISARFIRTIIALFMVASLVIILANVTILQGITNNVSKEFARLYATNTSNSLSTSLCSEIMLARKAAESEAVMNWFADEGNQQKKAAALGEFHEILRVLDCKEIYLAIDRSLNEYSINETQTVNQVNSHATLDPDYYDDAWYFECIASEQDYVLNVDIDKVSNQKRVWINYKVERDGVPLGIMCTALEFGRTAETVLAEYDNTKARCIIIDAAGLVQMDSLNRDEGDVLNFYDVRNEFDAPAFLAVLDPYLANREGVYNSNTPVVVEVWDEAFNYATITPILDTDWSVITFFNAASLFSITQLLPFFIIVFSMFVFFTVIASSVSYRILFKPVQLLIYSLSQVRWNKDAEIYGLDRNDEIANLAVAIRDMVTQANNDTLTGIYNRRYMDERMSQYIGILSRSCAKMCVLMIDVDFFKRYNDTYGHSKGDECLKKVAHALKSSLLRIDDFVARYGGEEFVVALPNTDEKGGYFVAERILKNVRDCNLLHESSDAAKIVTVSIGGVSCDVAHVQRITDYIKRADEALYVSKQNGRNQVTFLKVEQCHE